MHYIVIAHLNIYALISGVEVIVREDELIQSFGTEQLGRLGTDDERRTTDLNNIKTKLRSVARLCERIRCITNTKLFMTDYIQTKHFASVMQAAKDLSAVSPQLTITLGHYMRSLVLLKISASIAAESTHQRQQADDFKHLMEAHWRTQVATVTRRRQKLRKLNKTEEIPETEDLVKLSDYLKRRIETETDEAEVAKLCLTQLILFNKRRPLEVAELTKDDFQSLSSNSDNQSDNKELLESLSQTERMLAKRCCTALRPLDNFPFLIIYFDLLVLSSKATQIYISTSASYIIYINILHSG